MSAVYGFVRARIAFAVVVLVILGGGFFAYQWFEENNGTEETLVAERDTFLQQVSVSGKVVAVDDVFLGFVQGGRIAKVYTEIGEAVNAGAVLAETENTDIRALLLQRRATLAAEEANLDSLLEGTREEEIAVSEAAVASAEVVLAQANQTLVEKVQDAFRVADDAVRVQVDQFISNPQDTPQLTFSTESGQVRVEVENMRSTLELLLVAWEPHVFALSVSGDINAALAEAKDNLNMVAQFLIVANTAVNQGVPSGSITATTLDGYATDIATARSAVNAAITALTSAETSKKSAEASLVSAEKSLALKKAGATASTVAAQEAKVDAARAQVLDAQAQLEKTFITAPFEGVVTRVDVEVGELATAGVPVIAVISDETLQVESFVPEINISLLDVGDPATLTLERVR